MIYPVMILARGLNIYRSMHATFEFVYFDVYSMNGLRVIDAIESASDPCNDMRYILL